MICLHIWPFLLKAPEERGSRLHDATECGSALLCSQREGRTCRDEHDDGSAQQPGAITLSVGLYLVWVLATYLLEGLSLSSLCQRPARS